MNEDNSVVQRRLHLTKEQRLPNCYKEVEKIVKSVKSCQTNFKTALARSRLRGSQFKKVYKLSMNVLKYYNYIQKIIDKAEILIKEKFLRKELASILIYELIFGNGYLPGESKAVSTVQAYQNDVLNIHQDLQSHSTDFTEFYEIYVPRYVRVHTLLTTVPCVIKDLENYGFMQVLYDVDISEEKFFELVKSLEKGHFLVDFHFKDILVFVQDENLIELDLYKNGHIFLQDKASYIPVHVLNPQPGSTVIDACAAPGMKSAHIASKMKNKGILIACERDQSRFETLKETMIYGAVKISKTLCTDFKLIDPNDETYAAVEYILLDPSCSGSGMVNRMDNVTDTEDSKTKDRLIKLSGFQIILLKHAFKFPSVKRVVYSTCSVHEEENEYVVHEALNAFDGTFKLVPVLSDCFERGSENYEFGKICLRTVPEKHLTNGFFVAMFERIDPQEHSKNFSIKKAKYEATFRKHEDVILEKAESPEKFKFQTDGTPKKISLKTYKMNETPEEIPMDNIIENNDHFSKTSQKKEYSNLQQCPSFKKNDSQSVKQYGKFSHSNSSKESNKNYDLNLDDMSYRNHTKDTKEQRIPEFTVHKKKKKKFSTDIKFDKQNQEELVYITSSKLLHKCENSRSPKMCNVINETSNDSIVKKKIKHKRHQNLENISEIVECSSEILSNIKHKKKKKKHSESTNNSSFIETQCDKYYLGTQHQTAENNQNFNQNAVNAVQSSYTEESRELKMAEFSKHKKIEKGCAIKFQSDMIIPKEKPKTTLSESLQNWETSEVRDKKSKHKKKFNLENKLEITGYLETSVDSILSHKKKRRKREHSGDESICIYDQESESLNPKENPKATFADSLQNWATLEVRDKNPKHKKKFSSENNLEITGSLETSVGSTVNPKKKRRKREHSGDESIRICGQKSESLNPKATFSDSHQTWATLEVGDKSPKHKKKFNSENNLEITGSLETSVDSTLNHKRKRRKREHSGDESIHIYGQKSEPLNPKATFSDSHQNWAISEVGDKNPKHKKKFSSENNLEITGSLETSVGSTLNHKKKRRKKEHSGNEYIHICEQESEPLNKINSFVSKPESTKNREFPCSAQLDKSLQENKYSSETASLKVKKHKHKKH